MALEVSLGYPMHSVHHASIRTEENRVPQVCCGNEPYVISYRSAGCHIAICPKPEGLVQFAYFCQRDLNHRQLSRQLDQPVHVPDETPLF